MTTHPIKLTFTQIDAMIPTLLPNDLIDQEACTLDLVGETTHKTIFRAKLAECGIHIDDAAWLTDRDADFSDTMSITIDDPDSISRAQSFTNTIAHAYENSSDPLQAALWDDLQLGGDDDVDYCSSYFDSLWAILMHA